MAKRDLLLLIGGTVIYFKSFFSSQQYEHVYSLGHIYINRGIVNKILDYLVFNCNYNKIAIKTLLLQNLVYGRVFTMNTQFLPITSPIFRKGTSRENLSIMLNTQDVSSLAIVLFILVR